MRATRSGMFQPIRNALAVFLGVIILGACGYVLLLGWPLFDALYMAVITVTTVGYLEVRPMDERGRALTIALALVGVGAFMYMITAVSNFVITGELRGYFGARRMQRRIDELRAHYVICGYGRMGAQVVSELAGLGCPLVVIDSSTDAVQRCVDAGYAALQGDAGDDEVLRSAGIVRARALVTAVDDDATNLMIVLSARTMNDKLFIVARCNVESTESKLRRAGANRVVWPYGVSGRRMAHMAVRPNVADFLELLSHDENLELWMEELSVQPASTLAGRSIKEAAIRERTGTIVVAMRRSDGRLIVAPPSETLIAAGDVVVALGTRDKLARLGELASAR